MAGPWESEVKHPRISHHYGILLARPGQSLGALRPATALLLMPAKPAVRGITDGLLAYG